jgi:hypothetical protein
MAFCLAPIVFQRNPDEFMRRFFNLTFKPFFVVTGIGTVLGAVNAAWPQGCREGATHPVRPTLHDRSAALGILAGRDGRVHDRCLLGEVAQSDTHFRLLLRKLSWSISSRGTSAVPTRGACGSARGWTPRWWRTPSLTSPCVAWGLRPRLKMGPGGPERRERQSSAKDIDLEYSYDRNRR